MTNYGVVKSLNRPKNIEITDTAVFLASNIKPCDVESMDGTVSGFQYNYCGYTKDEYIEYLHNSLIEVQLALLEVMDNVDQN